MNVHENVCIILPGVSIVFKKRNSTERKGRPIKKGRRIRIEGYVTARIKKISKNTKTIKQIKKN